MGVKVEPMTPRTFPASKLPKFRYLYRDGGTLYLTPTAQWARATKMPLPHSTGGIRPPLADRATFPVRLANTDTAGDQTPRCTSCDLERVTVDRRIDGPPATCKKQQQQQQQLQRAPHCGAPHCGTLLTTSELCSQSNNSSTCSSSKSSSNNNCSELHKRALQPAL